MDPREISITIPEGDFLELYDVYSRKLDDNVSSLRICDIEILRGADSVIAWIGALKMVESDWEALAAEILRCLGWGGVGELPESACCDSMRASAKPIGEIGIAPSPASGNDRDSNSLAHLSDEAKIVAAKQAVAAYARNKQLPSAEHLAVFRELDSKAAGNKGASRVWRGFKFVQIDNIDRNDHSLSSESLGRACDQVWIGENAAPYRHLVCTGAERLAEVIRRGDAAADGERG